MIENPVFSGVLRQIFGVVSGGKSSTYYSQRAKSNLFISYSVFQSIPGSDCYLVGYKTGVPLRFLLGIVADPQSMDDVPEEPEPETDETTLITDEEVDEEETTE
jgi:hypothetical protein